MCFWCCAKMIFHDFCIFSFRLSPTYVTTPWMCYSIFTVFDERINVDQNYKTRKKIIGINTIMLDLKNPDWWYVLIRDYIAFPSLQYYQHGNSKLCLCCGLSCVYQRKASKPPPVTCLSLSLIVLVQSAWKLHLWDTVTWCRICSVTPPG